MATTHVEMTRTVHAGVDILNIMEMVECTIKEIEIESEDGTFDTIDEYSDKDIARVMTAVGEMLIERYEGKC